MALPIVSIIGTSGRTSDPQSGELTLTIFDRMITRARDIISQYYPDPSKVMLVSGAAAWADHVAVRLYLTGAYAGLKLFVPAKWSDRKFADTGVVDWRANPGGTLNYYHRAFSAKIGTDTLSEIGTAVERGAIINAQSGSFHQRNGEVAKAGSLVIAFTWSESGKPESGGTADTWKKIPDGVNKIHVSLKTLN